MRKHGKNAKLVRCDVESFLEASRRILQLKEMSDRTGYVWKTIRTRKAKSR